MCQILLTLFSLLCLSDGFDFFDGVPAAQSSRKTYSVYVTLDPSFSSSPLAPYLSPGDIRNSLWGLQSTWKHSPYLISASSKGSVAFDIRMPCPKTLLIRWDAATNPLQLGGGGNALPLPFSSRSCRNALSDVRSDRWTSIDEGSSFRGGGGGGGNRREEGGDERTKSDELRRERES